MNWIAPLMMFAFLIGCAPVETARQAAPDIALPPMKTFGTTTPFPARYSNTCWSLIAENDGVKVGAIYEPTPDKIAKVDGFISQVGETADVRQVTYEESEGWYDSITSDMLG